MAESMFYLLEPIASDSDPTQPKNLSLPIACVASLDRVIFTEAPESEKNIDQTMLHDNTLPERSHSSISRDQHQDGRAAQDQAAGRRHVAGLRGPRRHDLDCLHVVGITRPMRNGGQSSATTAGTWHLAYDLFAETSFLLSRGLGWGKNCSLRTPSGWGRTS